MSYVLTSEGVDEYVTWLKAGEDELKLNRKTLTIPTLRLIFDKNGITFDELVSLTGFDEQVLKGALAYLFKYNFVGMVKPAIGANEKEWKNWEAYLRRQELGYVASTPSEEQQKQQYETAKQRYPELLQKRISRVKNTLVDEEIIGKYSLVTDPNNELSEYYSVIKDFLAERGASDFSLTNANHILIAIYGMSHSNANSIINKLITEGSIAITGEDPMITTHKEIISLRDKGFNANEISEMKGVPAYLISEVMKKYPKKDLEITIVKSDFTAIPKRPVKVTTSIEIEPVKTPEIIESPQAKKEAEIREKIIELYNQNYNRKDISKIVNRTLSEVYDIINKYKRSPPINEESPIVTEESPIIESKNSRAGRKPKLTEEKIKEILQFKSGEDAVPVREIAEAYGVSEQTIYNVLNRQQNMIVEEDDTPLPEEFGGRKSVNKPKTDPGIMRG